MLRTRTVVHGGEAAERGCGGCAAARMRPLGGTQLGATRARRARARACVCVCDGTRVGLEPSGVETRARCGEMVCEEIEKAVGKASELVVVGET